MRLIMRLPSGEELRMCAIEGRTMEGRTMSLHVDRFHGARVASQNERDDAVDQTRCIGLEPITGIVVNVQRQQGNRRHLKKQLTEHTSSSLDILPIRFIHFYGMRILAES